jgi:transposase
MTPTALGRIVGEHDTRIWRVLEHYVDEARGRASFAGVTKVGVDETARAKGHVYISLFADLVGARVMYVTEGKDHETVGRFKQDLVEHGGNPAAVTDFSLDMSGAFIKGISEEFEGASLTFDKFHVIKLANDAVDKVRRIEQRTDPTLKKTRYVWLKNEENRTETEAATYNALKDSTLKTARAYRIKATLQGLYSETAATAGEFFRKWYFWATHSRLPPMIKLAKTLKRHQAGLLRWFDSQVNNGLLEGLNSLIQAAKARARGFRSARKMAVIIYLLLSKLDFQLPNALPSAIHTK